MVYDPLDNFLPLFFFFKIEARCGDNGRLFFKPFSFILNFWKQENMQKKTITHWRREMWDKVAPDEKRSVEPAEVPKT